VVVVAAVEAATFFALFLVLFLWCFLATLVVVAGFAGVVAASCAANAEPSTIAAPSIKAESFFMSVFFLFWGFSSPSLTETFRILEFR